MQLHEIQKHHDIFIYGASRMPHARRNHLCISGLRRLQRTKIPLYWYGKDIQGKRRRRSRRILLLCLRFRRPRECEQAVVAPKAITEMFATFGDLAVARVQFDDALIILGYGAALQRFGPRLLSQKRYGWAIEKPIASGSHLQNFSCWVLLSENK